MEDLKKKINFDPALLYYSTANKNDEDDVKNQISNTETYNSTNRKYICTICGKAFFTNSSLNVHMENHTSDEQIYIRDKDDNWKHRLMLNKGISCNKAECNFIALDAVEYQKHHTSCDGKRVLKFENCAFCDQCEHYFSSEDHVKAHSVLAHQENCSNISLQEDTSKQTVSDLVYLYVSENENGSKNISPSKYPDSSVTKKRNKNSEVESSKLDVSGPEEQNTMNSQIETSHELDAVTVTVKNDKIKADFTVTGEQSGTLASSYDSEIEEEKMPSKNNNCKISNNSHTQEVSLKTTCETFRRSEISETNTNVSSNVEHVDIRHEAALKNSETSEASTWVSFTVSSSGNSEASSISNSSTVTENSKNFDSEILTKNSEVKSESVNNNSEKKSVCDVPSESRDNDKLQFLNITIPSVTTETTVTLSPRNFDEKADSAVPSELSTSLESKNSFTSGVVNCSDKNINLAESFEHASLQPSFEFVNTKSLSSVHNKNENSVSFLPLEPCAATVSAEFSKSHVLLKSIVSESTNLVESAESDESMKPSEHETLVEQFETEESVNTSEMAKSIVQSESVKLTNLSSVVESDEKSKLQNADSSKSSELVEQSESNELSVVSESSDPAVSSKPEQSAVTCDTVKLAEEKYNGIEEMMYEMFKESDTLSENDKTPVSSAIKTNRKLSNEYDIKKELSSPTKAAEKSPCKGNDEKPTTIMSNSSIVDDLSDFKYEHQPMKKKYLKSYSIESQIKKNSEKSAVVQDDSEKKLKAEITSSLKKKFAVTNNATESKSNKTKDSLSPTNKKDKVEVPSSPKKKSVAILQNVSEENKMKQENVLISVKESKTAELISSSSVKFTNSQKVSEKVKLSRGIESFSEDVCENDSVTSTLEKTSTTSENTVKESGSHEAQTISSPNKKSASTQRISKNGKSKYESFSSPKNDGSRITWESSSVQIISPKGKLKQDESSTPEKNSPRNLLLHSKKKLTSVLYAIGDKEDEDILSTSTTIIPEKRIKTNIDENLTLISNSFHKDTVVSSVDFVDRISTISNVSASSINLNVKERSIRARKKLILPDYEYGFDSKTDNEDFLGLSSSKRSTPSTSRTFETSTPATVAKTSEDNAVPKKRGRPRKYPIVNNDAHEPKIDISNNIETNELLIENQKELETEEPEEFALSTAVSESESETSYSNAKNDEGIYDRPDEDSWLNKIDFSEQSVLDSWDEPQKKKRGRPRKNEVRSTKKLMEKKELPPPSSEKKKRGRPPKISSDDESITPTSQKKRRGRPRTKINQDDETIVEIILASEESEDDAVSSFESSISKSPKVSSLKVRSSKVPSPNVQSPKVQSLKGKRGRPPKVKEEPTEQLSSEVSSSNIDDFTERSSTIELITKHESNSPPKKRGRPRKIVENVNSYPEERNLNECEMPNKSKDDNVGESDDLKRRREFMQYIRIKDETNDPDYEPKQKSIVKSNLSDSSQKKSSRLSHKARSPNSWSAKHDRPYSIYNKYEAHAQNLLKRKRDTAHTFKAKKLEPDDMENQKRKEQKICNEEIAESEMKDVSEIQEILSETTTESQPVIFDTRSQLQIIDSVESCSNEKLIDKSDKQIKRRMKKQSRGKVSIASASCFEEIDETKNIDPDLYLVDMKNKSKYSKIFRKVTEIPKHDEYFPNSLVTCGRCKKLMTLNHYHKNHKISHYFITWLEGEPEIDLNQDSEIIRVMQQAVNPDAIRKKCIRLACEKCDKIMKSVVGYVSHIRFCQKMDETEFLGTCVLCGKRLKPSSLRHHYVKFHGISQPNVEATSKDDLILDNVVETPIKNASFVPMKLERKNYLKGFERTTIGKNDIIEDEQFWTSLKTSYGLYMCMGLSCRHMTLSKDDLKSHITTCSALFCEFKCVSCPYKTKYESEIIYHSKNFCKDSSDVEEKQDDKIIVDGRRTSTRVKKRSYRFDDYSSDEDRKDSKKKPKLDADFEPCGDDIEADDLDFEVDTDDDVTEKKSRFNKRKSDVSQFISSEETGLRQAFLYHNTTRNYDPLNWAVEIRLKTFSTCPVHENLKVDINEWETFPITDLPKHSPEQLTSMKIAQDNDFFTEYELFQSDLVKGVPVCYTGGPVWAMSWVPLPAQVTEQYLAVAGLKHMNHVVEMNSCVEFPSMVQIWKYSSLDNISNDIHKPVLAWAIAHKFGVVWCMEWCPSGGFDNSSDPYRLGILAMATSSGCVAVYSVPKLDCNGEARNIIANPEPDLILKIKNDNVQCTKIVWQRNLFFNTICGGFTDGMIALWNINSTSSLLKKGKEIYPFRMFEAHTSSITALDLHWLDNGRFMLTSSIDRTIKYWDLDDLSGPLYEVERSTTALNVAWMHHWIVAANAHDFCTSSDATAFLSHPRDIERKRSISALRDSFWSVAYSDWNDIVGISSNGGQVSVFAAKHLSTLSFKQPDYDKIITQTVILPLNDEDERNSESLEQSTDSPDTKDSFDCTSLIRNSALKFCDRVKSQLDNEKINFSPDQASVGSINKICWNQNYNSFNWLAIGYECGIVRVIRVERFDKHYLTKFYKMNENNSVALL